MSQSNYKNELRTKVEGLDQLLNCDQYGLRWSKDEDLLIVIRGQRGIGKVDLAMMIMNGIAETSKSAELPRFYSLEKNAVRLTEQYGRNFNLTQEQLEKIFPCVDGKSPTYQGQRMARFSDIIGQLDKDIRSKVPCIVIDGFSSLTQQEMDRIPLAALECKLRQKATVAILLFGSNMDNVPTGADIAIDMRRSVNLAHNYTFTELQISKSLFQDTTHGWHQYKHLPNGKIKVYPSVHKLLSMDDPLSYSIEQSFEDPLRYMASELHWPSVEQVGNCPTLGSVLSCQRRQPTNANTSDITAIIGPQNTFKRRLAAHRILDSLRNREHVLVVLLNEARAGFLNLLQSIDKQNRYAHNGYLHFWQLPMGCIGPDQFVNIVSQHIDDVKKQCCNAKLHVCLIDVESLDHAFPRLQGETLFLPALASHCRAKDTRLTMVCTKCFSQVKTVCRISDTVLCTQRKSVVNDGKADNLRSLTVIMEKNPLDANFNSRVFRYEIADVLNLEIGDFRPAEATEILSNKDYWRQAYNIKNNNEKMED